MPICNYDCVIVVKKIHYRTAFALIMCILFIAVNHHSDYPLIIAANRDEFHARETKPSHFWAAQPNLLAGRDMVGGGTWMGITKTGRISALTNIRAPGKEHPNPVTRGKLVSDFLTLDIKPEDYLDKLKKSRNDYNGYNLLFGSLNKLFVYNSFENNAYVLNDGVYGLSNASLNSPWPKLDMGRNTLANYCQNTQTVNQEHLFELLSNKQLAEDARLPRTGVPLMWEKRLSSIFIQSPDYGTRSSTVLLIDSKQKAYWEERTYSAEAMLVETHQYEFMINSDATYLEQTT